MNIVIADDEAPARARLAAMLAAAGEPYRVVAEAANGAEVLACCDRLAVDLVLLDIRMPGIDGIQAALMLTQRAHPPAVVFVTAYDEHALAAFEANAIDYLLKPVHPQRLQRALGKAAALSGEQRTALAASSGFVTATQRGGLVRIAAHDVVLLRADSKYVEVWHRDGLALTEESLRSIEQRLPGVFLRVHRNALILAARARALKRADDGRLLLTLDGCGETIEVSRRHAPEVRRLLRT